MTVFFGIDVAKQRLDCGFRRNPDRYSDLKPDSIPE
jgi:hypothetical protein